MQYNRTYSEEEAGGELVNFQLDTLAFEAQFCNTFEAQLLLGKWREGLAIVHTTDCSDLAKRKKSV